MSKEKKPINKVENTDSKVAETITEKIENIVIERLENVFADRFSIYSKYVIQDRTIPDARDGLKPVQRRILFGMYKLGVFHNKQFVKSARIAGEVMGKYHPHGDSSIYEALVRMSQTWKQGVKLVDMQGNNGSIDGDGAAAMRYTEARLSLASELLIKDIEKKTVAYVPNFDDSELEPTIFPANFPNLLVNGCFGISTAFSSKIPPHNLGEVIDLTLYILDHYDETIGIDKVLEFIKGPDFPTGGIVMGIDGIKQALETGMGRMIIRSKTEFEEISKTQDRIVITEIPYDVVKSVLVTEIDDIRVSNKVAGILEVRDESDKDGLRVAIDLDKNADSNVILNYLFKNTSLQISYNYNMVSIINRRPEVSGVVRLLRCYIDHQREVKTNKCNFDLEKDKGRLHIVEGLIKSVSILDEIIAIIRNSKDKNDSKINLMNKFGFSELQAEAIVTLRLYRLSNTDILLLTNEHKELQASIKKLTKILDNEDLLFDLIKTELSSIREQLATPRKSVIKDEIAKISFEQKDLVDKNDYYIGVSKEGYLKKSNEKSYNSSNVPGLKEGDCYILESLVSNLSSLLMFTSKGNYINLPVFRIEDQKWKDLGKFISNYIAVDKDEKIIKTFVISNFEDKHSIILATKNGKIKRTLLKEYEISRQSKPSRAISLDKDDKLVSADIGYETNVVMLTTNGIALRFVTKIGLSEIKGLNASGPQGISLSSEVKDSCIGAYFAGDDDDIVILTQRGNIIKVNVMDIRPMARNRRGITVINKLKTNPHYAVSFSRVTKNQFKNNVVVKVITDSKLLSFTANDFKYYENKNGKNLIDVALDGIPESFSVAMSKDDIIGLNDDTILDTPTIVAHSIFDDYPENKEEEKEVVKEEDEEKEEFKEKEIKLLSRLEDDFES